MTELMIADAMFSNTAVSIGFDLIAMALTAAYIAKLVVEQFMTPAMQAGDSLVLEPSVQKRSLLSQAVFRRAR